MTEDAEVRDLVASAYQKERFTMTLADVEQRATGRRRTRWVPAIATGLALVAVIAAGWRLAGADAAPMPADIKPNDFATACMRHWNQQQSRLPEEIRSQKPVERFAFEHGNNKVRIYASKDALLECVRTADGFRAGVMYALGIESPFASDNQPIRYFGHYDGPNYLVGELPEGMTGVEAVLSNGDRVRAQVSGRLFAIWQPTALVDGAQLTSFNDAGQGPTATAPSQPGAVLDQRAFDEFCMAKVYTAFSGRPSLVTKRLNQYHIDDHDYWLYSNEYGLALCTVSKDAFGLSSGILADNASWTGLEPPQHMTLGLGELNFMVGRAPEGAQAVVVTLADGSKADGFIEEILFAVHWVGPPEWKKITFVSPGKTWEFDNDKL